MSTSVPRRLLEVTYFQEAQAYLRRLPPEHFMEATTQATQRKIFVVSMDLVHVFRSDVQSFSELLVQYPRKGRKKLGQVVPDNMVVVHPEPIEAEGSYDLPLQPVGPLWVLEYVSKNSKRKDYEHSMDKYEHELKVPYYLLFYPETQDMSLYHHDGQRYHSVKPNAQGRVAIPELELELGLLEGWVRFWFRGELLPLTAELQRELELTRARLLEAEERAGHAEERAGKAEERAGMAEERAGMAEERAGKAEERASEAARLLEAERQARLTAEQQLAELQARLAETGKAAKKNRS